MFESRNRPFAPALAAALAGIALAGCHASSEGPESPPPPTEVAIAKFNIATGTLPYPYRPVLRISARSAADGTLNLPTVPWRTAAMQAALNAQDGWSTTRQPRHELHAAARCRVDQRQLGEDRQAVAGSDHQGAGDQTRQLPADGRDEPGRGHPHATAPISRPTCRPTSTAAARSCASRRSSRSTSAAARP